MTRHGWAVAVLVGATSLALAGGVKRASTPVPPTQELELLDPNVDPTGKPAVIVRPNPLGGQLIDIPPTILVHRFYYTGDRSFQGPMLPGGPMIVVASHPKTFERVYVPVMLPPGAPRVFYTPSTIRYDFGPQSVTLAFTHCGLPKVLYSQSTVLGTNFQVWAAGAAARARDFLERTGLPAGIQKVREESRELVGSAADRINDLGKAVAVPVGKAVQSATQTFKTSAEERAGREQDRLQKLVEGQTKDLNQFIPRGP